MSEFASDSAAGPGVASRGGALLRTLADAASGRARGVADALAALDRVEDALAWPSKSGKGKAAAVAVELKSAARQDGGGGGGGGGDDEDEDAALAAAEAETSALLDLFLSHQRVWSDLSRAAATVDVIASFASFAATHDGPTCRPTFVDAEGGGATLELENVWHPCAVAGGMLRGRAGAGGTSGIVPNDVVLGDVARETPRAMLLTGANMGGKSTLLRRVRVFPTRRTASSFFSPFRI